MDPMQKYGETYVLNVRFALIALVVLGNAFVPVAAEHADVRTATLFIFVFHIPLFAFVTGYVSKSFLKASHKWRQFGIIFGQYCLFQTAYSALDAAWFHTEAIRYSFFLPYGALWFLVSHLMWKLLLFGFAGRKYAVAWAILLGCMAGYAGWSGEWASLSRTFAYFPFFLAGYMFQSAWFEKWFVRGYRRFAAAGLGLLLAGCFLFRDALPLTWLMGHLTYAEMQQHAWYAGLLRLALYGLQFAAGLCVLALVPARDGRMTELGRRTIYVFLFHGFALKSLAAAGLYELELGLLTLPALAAVSIAVTLLLSNATIDRALKPFVDLEAPKRLRKPVERFILRAARR